jgi:hypothetical protein
MAPYPAIIFGLLAFALLPLATAQSASKTEIVISGAPDHGVFDPSVARSDSGRLYMSLSGVSSTAEGGSLGALAVRTLLAHSDDQGRSWQLDAQFHSSADVHDRKRILSSNCRPSTPHRTPEPFHYRRSRQTR